MAVGNWGRRCKLASSSRMIHTGRAPPSADVIRRRSKESSHRLTSGRKLSRISWRLGRNNQPSRSCAQAAALQRPRPFCSVGRRRNAAAIWLKVDCTAVLHLLASYMVCQKRDQKNSAATVNPLSALLPLQHGRREPQCVLHFGGI